MIQSRQSASGPTAIIALVTGPLARLAEQSGEGEGEGWGWGVSAYLYMCKSLCICRPGELRFSLDASVHRLYSVTASCHGDSLGQVLDRVNNQQVWGETGEERRVSRCRAFQGEIWFPAKAKLVVEPKEDKIPLVLV